MSLHMMHFHAPCHCSIWQHIWITITCVHTSFFHAFLMHPVACFLLLGMVYICTDVVHSSSLYRCFLLICLSTIAFLSRSYVRLLQVTISYDDHAWCSCLGFISMLWCPLCLSSATASDSLSLSTSRMANVFLASCLLWQTKKYILA